MAIIYKGDQGFKLRVETNVDLTNATNMSLAVKKPDGTVVQWISNAPPEAGLNGNSIMVYISGPNDFDVAGDYLIQALIELPPPAQNQPPAIIRGTTAVITVKDHFE